MSDCRQEEAVLGSFRDPSGFTFFKDDSIYRQVNFFYKEDYERLMASGLYKELTSKNLLIPHEEVNVASPKPALTFKVIKPEKISFISYPYEWCFSQLKDAGLALLEIQKIALEFGMSLKDASAYNIQFRASRPVLIDTLSFEKYREGEPWVAYRQFCQHFLAPLALASYKDVRLGQLLRIYIDGIPLDLASSLLPLGTRFKFSLFSHIHLHSKYQRRFAKEAVETEGRRLSRMGLSALIDNLKTSVERLKTKPKASDWSDYYDDTIYTDKGLDDKERLVGEFLTKASPSEVWDLGANTGCFSRIASDRGIETISFDSDPFCVEKNYSECVKYGETKILPLVMDLANPSPGIGWANKERPSLIERGPTDTVLALALVHHLAISNNLPLDRIASFFAGICRCLIIEFVPKSDPMVKRLLATRKDIFPDYTEEAFRNEFGRYFEIRDSAKISGTERTIYYMSKR